MTLMETPPPPSPSAQPPVPEQQKSSGAQAGKIIVSVIIAGVVGVFLLAIVAIAALRVLGTTVSTEFSAIDVAQAQAETEFVPSFTAAFTDPEGRYTFTPYTHWRPIAPPANVPADSEAWSVGENGITVANIVVASSAIDPAVDARMYIDQVVPFFEGLPESITTSEIVVENGREYVVISSEFTEENGDRNAVRQVALLGEESSIVAQLSSRATLIDQIADIELDAIFTIEERVAG